MIPSFLITFREVIEASLIVATIIGILAKVGSTKEIKIVWAAVLAAVVSSISLLLIASYSGYQIQKLYAGRLEEFIEGTLMIVSALFITWAIFFLHNFFGRYKVALLQSLNTINGRHQHMALFILSFTAVFREGIEIVLFLSTIYLTADPGPIMTGAFSGFALGMAISVGVVMATVRLPVHLAFKFSSWLLVFFAAGLLGRGLYEFSELGILPSFGEVTFLVLPTAESFLGMILKSILGLTQSMHGIQFIGYIAYIYLMAWYIHLRHKHDKLHTALLRLFSKSV